MRRGVSGEAEEGPEGVNVEDRLGRDKEPPGRVDSWSLGIWWSDRVWPWRDDNPLRDVVVANLCNDPAEGEIPSLSLPVYISVAALEGGRY